MKSILQNIAVEAKTGVLEVVDNTTKEVLEDSMKYSSLCNKIIPECVEEPKMFESQKDSKLYTLRI